MSNQMIREPLIFLDLETTGANFANDRIIEIGVVEVGQDGAREWSSLVNPGRPVIRSTALHIASGDIISCQRCQSFQSTCASASARWRLATAMS